MGERMIKQLLIVSAIMLAVGFLGGRYVAPPKEITKVEVQEREVIKKDVVTVVKEVTRPDGSKETTTTTTDKSTEKKDKEAESIVSKPVEKQWFVTAGASKDLSDFEKTIYQAGVNRRILGPIYVGIQANTNQEIGINIGMEF